MNQNIFQVINESHFNEILSNHTQDLVVVMISSKDCAPCRLIKPKFVELSKQHKDIFFVYVDRSNYVPTENKYFTEFEYTPTFVFYFGRNKIAFVEGGHEPSLVKAILVLKQKIEDKRQEIQQQELILENQKLQELANLNLKQQQPPITEELILLNKKMELLNKLRELNNMGARLTKNYNLDSSVDELMFEYQFHTNPQFKQQIMAQLLPQTQQHILPNTSASPSPSPHPLSSSLIDQTPELPPLPPMPTATIVTPAITQVAQDYKDDLAKKQEQVRQIKELDLLNQQMQAQSLQKLQQLRRIQQMKEQQEKNNEKQ